MRELHTKLTDTLGFAKAEAAELLAGISADPHDRDGTGPLADAESDASRLVTQVALALAALGRLGASLEAHAARCAAEGGAL